MYIEEKIQLVMNIDFLKRFSFNLNLFFILYFEVFILNSCELASFVTYIACFIAKDKTSDELNLLSAIFSQLGDTLDTIASSMPSSF